MPFPRPSVDIRRPPLQFDALIDWFELVSYNLVLLEEYRLEDIRSAVNKVASSIEAHCDTAATLAPDEGDGSDEIRERTRILAADHAWFRTSIEQLRWFLGVVEQEDHGGHRQALGQYGRVLCESVRRHLAEEDEIVRRAKNRSATSTATPRPSNPN